MNAKDFNEYKQIISKNDFIHWYINEDNTKIYYTGWMAGYGVIPLEYNIESKKSTILIDYYSNINNEKYYSFYFISDNIMKIDYTDNTYQYIKNGIIVESPDSVTVTMSDNLIRNFTIENISNL